MPDLILHHYWPSPFAHKVRLALGLANAKWLSVEIPRVPPKPLLTPLTAGYRRTPILQIGADIYCDTQNIVRELADFGFSRALFPEGCMSKALAFSAWIDGAVFELAARVVITNALDTAPSEFIKDRGDLYFEPGWTNKKLNHDLSSVVLQLDAQLKNIDDILTCGENICSKELSYADVSVAYLAWFLRGRWEAGPKVLSRYPNICRIENAVYDCGEGQYQDLGGKEAMKIANDNIPKSLVGIDGSVMTELSLNQRVGIRPRTQSSDPIVFGELRYLDRQRVSINNNEKEVGAIAVHFPISGYEINLEDFKK
jgi:glutathione S-transferase